MATLRVRITDPAHPAYGRVGEYDGVIPTTPPMQRVRLCWFSQVTQAWSGRCIVIARLHQLAKVA